MMLQCLLSYVSWIKVPQKKCNGADVISITSCGIGVRKIALPCHLWEFEALHMHKCADWAKYKKHLPW